MDDNNESFYTRIKPMEVNDSITYKVGNDYKPGNTEQFYNENKTAIDGHIKNGIPLEDAVRKVMEEKNAEKVGISKNPALKIKNGKATSFYKR